MNYLELKDEIETKHYSSFNDAIKAVGELSHSLKQTLCYRIDQLDVNQINDSAKRQMHNVAESWEPIVDWQCSEVIDSYELIDGSANIKWHYKVSITSDLNKIINNYVSKLCSAFEENLLRYSEKALLDDIYMHYRHLSNCSGLEVSDGENGTLTTVEKNLEWLMEMYFRVKVVEYEGEFASGDYFEIRQANIPQAKTVKKALVSSDDNSILCIQKGLFVSPLNNNNND